MFDNLFKTDIAIDLGTASSQVYVKNKGVIINEPTRIAVNKKTGEMVVLGTEAKKMIGRAPVHIEIIKPIVHSVISDFEASTKLIESFLLKTYTRGFKRIFNHSNVLIGVPVLITEVERRAAEEVVLLAGAERVRIIEEPIASALGSYLDIHNPRGNIIVDIGEGTTKIAVISIDGFVVAKTLKIAGAKLTDDIVRFVKEEFQIVIGESSAEEAKVGIASFRPKNGDKREMLISGRDINSGLPKSVLISSAHIQKATEDSIFEIIHAIKNVVEMTPPEIISEVLANGLTLSGGSSQIPGLSALVNDEVEIKVKTADEPPMAAIRGMGMIIENYKEYEPLLISSEESLVSV